VQIGRIERDPDGVSVQASTRTMRLLSVGFFLAALGSGVGLIFVSSLSDKLMFSFCMATFGGVALMGFSSIRRQRSRRMPIIRVTEAGIEHPFAGLIGWDEIDDVGMTRIFGNRALGIWTSDPFLAVRRGPRWLWPFAIFNRVFGYPPLSFTASSMPIDEVFREIESQRARSASRERRQFAAGSRRGTRTTR
jgi:hypothetical protein